MIYADFDLDEEIALLEAAGGGAEKYLMHSNAHQMAFSKYAMKAKMAKETGDGTQARMLRAIGKKHKAAAEALAGIAGHHVDHQYARQMRVQKAMNESETMDRKPESVGQRVKVHAPGYESHGKEGTISYSNKDGSFHAVDYDEGSSGNHHGGDLHPINEISNRKIRRYVKHATRDADDKDESAANQYDFEDGENDRMADQSAEKAADRREHIDRAKKRLRPSYTGTTKGINEMEDDEVTTYNPISELIASAIEKRAVDFREIAQEIIRDRVATAVEDLRIQVSEAFGGAGTPNDDDENQEKDDEDDEIAGDSIKPAKGNGKDEETDSTNEEVIDEISGKTLGSYVQKARADNEKRRVHHQELDNHPSVKKIKDKRSELYGRKEYDSRGRSKHRDAIDRTYSKEAVAKDKLDPKWRDTTRAGKRIPGITKAIDKLQYGKMTEISIEPTGKEILADHGKTVSDPSTKTPPTIKKVAFSKKKPEQKSVSVAAGDTFRSQEAAD